MTENFHIPEISIKLIKIVLRIYKSACYYRMPGNLHYKTEKISFTISSKKFYYGTLLSAVWRNYQRKNVLVC